VISRTWVAAAVLMSSEATGRSPATAGLPPRWGPLKRSWDRGGLCQPTRVHERSTRAIIAAFLANLGIAIMKFAGRVVTGSASLLAEAEPDLHRDAAT
jgi:hypothetical protein